MIRALVVIALLAAGCGQNTGLPEPAAEKVAMTTTQRRGVAAGGPAPFAAFDPGPAAPDSGTLTIAFLVPRYDNAGTCEAPVPDSMSPGLPLWARVYRERMISDGVRMVTEAVAESFYVQRGERVTFARRVPCDTFTVINVRLYNGTKAGCRVYAPSMIVQPSAPPAVEMVR